MYNIIVNTAVFCRCRLSCTLWKFILGKARKKGLLTYSITPESLLLCHNGKVKFSLHTGKFSSLMIIILIQLILLSCMGVEQWWLVLPLMLMRVIWCNILFTSHVWVQCPSPEMLLCMCCMILGQYSTFSTVHVLYRVLFKKFWIMTCFWETTHLPLP